jgi:hypothetical protein
MSILRQFSKYLMADEHGEFNLAQVQELSWTGRSSMPRRSNASSSTRWIWTQSLVEDERERLRGLCPRGRV